MENKDDFLGTEPIKGLLFKLALPTLVAQVINMLYNIVDRVYIGHIKDVGALALTGVGVCMPIILIVSAFAALIASGGAPLASISMGEGNSEKAEKILGNCFSTQIIISIILTTILLIFNEKILLLFGASKNTIKYATEYMDIYSIGTIFVQLTLGMNAFITAQGFAKIGMLSVLIGAVSNIILDPIFIFAMNMGVKGAALATIISQSLSCIWIMYFLIGKKTKIRLKRTFLKIERDIIVPCMTSLLKYGGDIAVGSMTILTSVMQFALLPLQGIGQGAQPIISFNFGAKNKDRVKETFLLLVKISVGYSALLWLLVMIMPQVFVKMFTTSPELIAFTETSLRVYMGGLMLFGIQVACQMTFTSIGNAKGSIMVAVMRKFVLLIPLIYIMPRFLENKTMAVYMAEPIADILAVLFTSILFIFQFKKILRDM